MNLIKTATIIILSSFILLSSSETEEKEYYKYFDKTTLIQNPEYKIKPEKYICTAYDLSVESCGKTPDHPAYGLTASGVSLKNKSWNEARAIAVDPRMIKMGSKVLLVFHSESRKKYTGIYTAVDTGGDIKQKRIDVFIPNNREALQFGRTEADVYVLR